MRNLYFLISACALASCASMSYSPSITKTGEMISTSESPAQKADEMSWSEAQDVKVFIGQPPEGLSIDGDSLVATSSSYKVLALVTAQPSGDVMNSFWWFYDYSEDEKWRKPFCWVQTPLVWASMTLWAWISPTHIPCKVYDNSNSPNNVEMRKMRIINTLKKSVKAVGGNILVITKLGKLDFINNSGAIFNTIEMTSAQGYAIKQN